MNWLSSVMYAVSSYSITILLIVVLGGGAWVAGRSSAKRARATQLRLAEASNVPALTAAGWMVVYRDAQGTQLRRPKRWNTFLLAFGVLLPVLAGFLWNALWVVALVCGIVAVVSYLMTTDGALYIPSEAQPAAPPVAAE